jgi:hypothetical protein
MDGLAIAGECGVGPCDDAPEPAPIPAATGM